MNQLKYIFGVALVAVFAANAGAGPFAPDYGSGEVCAALTADRVTRIDDECSTALMQPDARLRTSAEQSPAASHQPLSEKD